MLCRCNLERFERSKTGFAVRTAAWLAMVVVAGCESGREARDPEPASPEATACSDFCEAARAVGCPKNAGNCVDDCLSLAKLGCEDLLVPLLECAGASLTSECAPRGPDGSFDCATELAFYDECLPIDVRYPLSSCGASTASSPDIATGCEGALTCDASELAVHCDAGGTCLCVENGQTLGTCTNIVASAYFCAPHRSCCAPFFAPR